MQQPPPPPAAQPEPAHRRGSSSTCSTAPRRSVGCMAGLLRLFSPYHRSHHRKRLTAKSAAAKALAPQPQPPPPSSPQKKRAEAPLSPFLPPAKPKQPQPQQQPAAVRRRRSCDAPRSLTIAPEHRRSSCDSPRPPPLAIVARLMGLEESAPPSPATAPRPVLPTRPPPPPPPPAPPSQPETAAEKRRKLLGALEKCDEDLKTLRRIIAAVRAAEMRAAAASDVAPAAGTPPPPGKGAAKWRLGRDELSPSPSPSPPLLHKPSRAEEPYPSPDSVLDAISSPRFPCRKRPSPCTDHEAGCGNGTVAPTAAGAKIVKPSRTFVFSGDYYCKIKVGSEPQKRNAVGGGVHHAPRPPVLATTEACALPARLPRAAGAESWRHHRRRWELEAAAAGRVIGHAMAESVAEAWGQQGEQRRECGRVAAALERAVLQDLVADVVSELLAQPGHGHGGGCRKRLCF